MFEIFFSISRVVPTFLSMSRVLIDRFAETRTQIEGNWIFYNFFFQCFQISPVVQMLAILRSWESWIIFAIYILPRTICDFSTSIFIYSKTSEQLWKLKKKFEHWYLENAYITKFWARLSYLVGENTWKNHIKMWWAQQIFNFVN